MSLSIGDAVLDVDSVPVTSVNDATKIICSRLKANGYVCLQTLFSMVLLFRSGSVHGRPTPFSRKKESNDSPATKHSCYMCCKIRYISSHILAFYTDLFRKCRISTALHQSFFLYAVYTTILYLFLRERRTVGIIQVEFKYAGLFLRHA